MVDPTVGSARMEVRKLGRNYSQLLELMLEHCLHMKKMKEREWHWVREVVASEKTRGIRLGSSL